MFRITCDRPESGASEEYSIRLIKVKERDREFDIPQGDEIAGLIVGDIFIPNCNKYIIMHLRSEKKKSEKKVEYRRTDSERVMKTASWRSQSMDGLRGKEFHLTVETYIKEKKKTLNLYHGVLDQWQNGAVDSSG
ncbi:hypothetical protein ISN44_As13g007170 [Arabidopsis suecica]|uniref:Uncharacterized protein n=1 Tax=Arabidopsis suecica TaxID=45249 RepID=A0A8T1XQ43_ARASU|nr:hypothetical protein ISN44_As13g007170 [Arabidopsis suecica]